MQVLINGEPEELEQDTLSITELLTLKKVESPDMVSVQLNGEFIDRQDYSTTMLSEKDALEFLYFMGGGAGA